VRILLAWPYSLAAGLREQVLTRYAAEPLAEDFAIQSSVIANLETLEATIRASRHPANLEIRLYDNLPSLALYRAGSTLLAAPFLHGALAVHTFQLELDLRASDALLTGTLLNDFERMWTVARPFLPAPDRNWRNERKNCSPIDRHAGPSQRPRTNPYRQPAGPPRAGQCGRPQLG
jgi:hypothetical protein